MPQVRLHWYENQGRRAQEDLIMAVASAAVEGFALSLGLILALGPQHVFVMRQGLMKSHVFAV